MADDRKELEVFRLRELRRRADPVLQHARAVARGVVRRVAAPFLYEGAGRRAPREVQKAIERFRQLPDGVRAQTPLLYWLLGAGTPLFKLTKEEARYGPPPPELVGRQSCANCVSSYIHSTTNTPICDQMRGVIEPTAWCARWRPPISVAAYRTYQDPP